MSARGHRPLGHAVRVLFRVLLDRLGCAPVRVAFAQHRVHRAAQAFGVAVFDGLFLIGLRISGIVRDRVALVLQFLDGGPELGHRGADVRQLDDVGVRQLRQPAKLGQVVRHTLRFGQVIGKLGQDACRHGDVAGLDIDARRLGKGPDDRQKGVRRQQRRLVGQRVDDGRLLGAHVLFSRRQFRSDSKELCVANGGYQYRVGHGVSCDMPGVCLKSRSIVVPGVPSDHCRPRRRP